MAWGPDCLLPSCVLMSSFCSTAKLWVKAEKLSRKENHLHAAGKRQNFSDDALKWYIRYAASSLSASGGGSDLDFQSGLKLVAMVFPSFLYVAGQNSACYLLKEMRPCICAFPFPSCGLHFPKAILSNFYQNLYNTDFSYALNCLLTERQMTAIAKSITRN